MYDFPKTDYKVNRVIFFIGGSTATDLLLDRRILPFMLSGPIDQALRGL
jgi:hypothetical protein